VPETVNWKEQRAVTDRQGFVRMLAFYDDILKGKETSLSRQISELDIFKSASKTRVLLSVMLETGDGDQMTRCPTVQAQEPSL
jgi:hypothetical protein